MTAPSPKADVRIVRPDGKLTFAANEKSKSTSIERVHWQKVQRPIKSQPLIILVQNVLEGSLIGLNGTIRGTISIDHRNHMLSRVEKTFKVILQ